MNLVTDLSPRYWRAPGVVIALICAIAFVALGLRAILIPAVTSAGFGLPAQEAASQVWVMVYGSRTLLLGVFALALLIRRQLIAVALLFSLGALMPIFDMAVLWRFGDLSAFVMRHSTFILVLGIVAALLWRDVRRGVARI